LYEAKSKVSKLWSDAEEGIAEMKGSKHYALGQKIPASVKAFNRQEIENKRFSAKHSSFLRVLTKWAGYLEKIFKNPEQFIKRRTYAFKNLQNQLVNINPSDEEGVNKLVKRLGEEYSEVKRKFGQLLSMSYGSMGKFLSEQSGSLASSVERYS
jgi:hypothetical protein